MVVQLLSAALLAVPALELIPQLGHTGPIITLEFSPDGRSILTVGADRRLRVWDVESELVVRQTALEIETTREVTLRLSPDGRSVLVSGWAGGEGLIGERFDLEDGRRLAAYAGGAAGRLEFTCDGAYVFNSPPSPGFWEAVSGALVPGTLGKSQTEVCAGGDAEVCALYRRTAAETCRPVRFEPAAGVALRERHRLPPAPSTGPSCAATNRCAASATSPDGQTIVFGVGAELWLFDLTTLALTRKLGGQVDRATALTASSDGRYLAIATSPAAGDRAPIVIWDLHAGRVVSRIDRRRPRLYVETDEQLRFSPDGARLVGLDGATLASWDRRTSRRLTLFGAGPEAKRAAIPLTGDEAIARLLLSPTLERAYVESCCGDAPPRFVLWDLVRGRATPVQASHFDLERPNRFSADGRHLLMSVDGSTARVAWDAVTGRTRPSEALAGLDLSHVRPDASPSGRRATRYPAHRDVVFVQGADGNPIGKIDLDATQLAWLSETHLAAVGPSGVPVLLELDRAGATVLRRTQLLAGRSGEWLMVDDAGYFDASRGGAHLLGIGAQGRRGHPVDQLAAYTNRGDRLLAGLGSPDLALMEELRDLHFARLRRLGLPPEPPPNRPSATLTGTLDGKRVELRLGGRASGSPLVKLQLWVNDVPLLGPAGRSIRETTTLDLSEVVELTAGRNRVELSVTDRGGAESLRAPLELRVDGVPEGRVFYVGIGVSRYTRPELALGYAHRDALDLAERFRALTASEAGSAGKGPPRAKFTEARIFTALDADVTKATLERAGEFLAESTPADLVVFFLAGHGVQVGGKYYYLLPGSDLSTVSETGLDFEAVEALLYATPARRKLLLLDTCESGERAEGLAGLGDTRGLSSRAVRRVGGPAPAVVRRSNRDRFLYDDLLRRSGAVVFSSSAGDELSYESSALENGLFTEALLAALGTRAGDADRDGWVGLAELQRWVADRVAELSGGRQHPTIDKNNLRAELWFPAR